MTRLVAPFTPRRGDKAGRQGYTLVEILTATALTLLMMTAVVAVLGTVSTSISNSRSGLEMMDRLRSTQRTLRRDLENVTTTMVPPRSPESNEGYFEYVEGPIGPVLEPGVVAYNADTGESDSTVGDFDDVLMFTVHSPDVPFVGRARYKRAPVGAETTSGSDNAGGLLASATDFVFQDVTVQSQDAEVFYFVRFRTLHRRVLLVLPSFDFDARVAGNQGAIDRDGFYAFNDISVHLESPGVAPGPNLVPNSLGDLTKPNCRFGHNPAQIVFPSHPHSNPTCWLGLKLPTLCECSAPNWTAGNALPTLALTSNLPAIGGLPDYWFDAWTIPYPFTELDPATGSHSDYYNPSAVPATQRVGEDVILTNVIGFDVKAWDPGAPVLPGGGGTVALVPGDPGYLATLASGAGAISYGAYADLNYMCLLGPSGSALPNYAWGTNPYPRFYSAGQFRSGLQGVLPFARNFTDPQSWPGWPSFSGVLASVYDTWSTHYEHDGVNEYDGCPNPSPPPAFLALTDEGTDGFDNDTVGNPGYGVVDEPDEFETSPPYPVPLRGVQVKIRVFEPDGRQVREVTVVQDFLPK